jgi:hypothetical protein
LIPSYFRNLCELANPVTSFSSAGSVEAMHISTAATRVLPGKPIRFSNGALAPRFTDLVIGFGIFFCDLPGLTLLLFGTLRLWQGS